MLNQCKVFSIYIVTATSSTHLFNDAALFSILFSECMHAEVFMIRVLLVDTREIQYTI